MKETNKKYFLIILGLLLAIIVFSGGKYLVNEIKYQRAKQSDSNQFANIEAKIYDTSNSAPNQTAENPTKFDNEVLLKQQVAITELQKNYNDLKLEVTKLQHQNQLPKMILGFISLRDDFDQGKNYQEDLQKFELLCGHDLALTNKVVKLKSLLKNPIKTNQEISIEFSALIPQIIAEKTLLNSNQNWQNKLKAQIAKLIVIRRVDGKVEKPGQDVDLMVLQTEKAINNQQYDQALQMIAALNNDYQTIFTKLIPDLQNVSQLQQISSDIYSYLQELSNQTNN